MLAQWSNGSKATALALFRLKIRKALENAGSERSLVCDYRKILEQFFPSQELRMTTIRRVFVTLWTPLGADLVRHTQVSAPLAVLILGHPEGSLVAPQGVAAPG